VSKSGFRSRSAKRYAEERRQLGIIESQRDMNEDNNDKEARPDFHCPIFPFPDPADSKEPTSIYAIRFAGKPSTEAAVVSSRPGALVEYTRKYGLGFLKMLAKANRSLKVLSVGVF
jgi:hypothetical protein